MVITGVSVFGEVLAISLYFSHSASDQRGCHSQSSAMPPPIPTPSSSLKLSLTFGSQNCRFCSSPHESFYHSSIASLIMWLLGQLLSSNCLSLHYKLREGGKISGPRWLTAQRSGHSTEQTQQMITD